MAEKHPTSTPVAWSTHSRHTEYPWHHWFDGFPWKLTRGEDFTLETDNFTRMARVRARAAGMRLRTHKEDDGQVLWIQVTGPVDPAGQQAWDEHMASQQAAWDERSPSQQ